MLLLYNPKSVACNLCLSWVLQLWCFFFCRPKTGDSSSDEESKEVSAASCQERLQPVDREQHPSPYTYRKSLRLSSDQIVSAFLRIFLLIVFHSIPSVILNILTFNFQGEKILLHCRYLLSGLNEISVFSVFFCWGLLFRLERPL